MVSRKEFVERCWQHRLMCLRAANSLLSVIDRVGGCPVCMHPFDRSHIINLSQPAPEPEPSSVAALAPTTLNKKRRKGKAEAPATAAQDEEGSNGVFHSSAKLDAVLRTLRQVLKVIIVRNEERVGNYSIANNWNASSNRTATSKL
jgi:hypothetical protein